MRQIRPASPNCAYRSKPRRKQAPYKAASQTASPPAPVLVSAQNVRIGFRDAPDMEAGPMSGAGPAAHTGSGHAPGLAVSEYSIPIRASPGPVGRRNQVHAPISRAGQAFGFAAPGPLWKTETGLNSGHTGQKQTDPDRSPTPEGAQPG